MARKGERKTVCIHGHKLTPDNVRINSRGAQVCRTCERDQRQRGRAIVAARALSVSDTGNRDAMAKAVKPEVLTAEAFTAQLQAETEASLRRDPSRWRWETSRGGREWRASESPPMGTLGRAAR
jgi:hypothetical protein